MEAMKFKTLMLLGLLVILFAGCDRSNTPFKIGSKMVVEGEYTARALSPTQMNSNYPMNLDTSIPQPILFKLSLNGRDNEAGFGQDHHLIIPPEISEFFAPQLQFGLQGPAPPGTPEAMNQATNVHFRVDLRPVLEAFEAQSFFVTPTKDTIYAHHFEGLYIAGGTAPLEWIWDSAEAPEHLRFEDLDQDSIYELSLSFTPATLSRDDRNWTLSQDISHLPEFSSPQAPLLEALTNLALEEAL